MKKFLLIIMGFCVLSQVHAQIVNEYDFNNLNTEIGLDGQDDWHTILNLTGPDDFYLTISTGDIITPDGTIAAWYNGNGAGYGRTATRKATSNFDFDLTQADIVEIELVMHTNWWGMYFGVGYDADGDNHIVPNLPTEPDDGGVYITIGNYPDVNKVTLPDGTSVSFTAEEEGWCKYKIGLNFLANDGAGAISLSYDKGITGEWVAIPEIQGLNLGLTPGSGDKNDRTVWDGIFFTAWGGTAAFDNIVIKEMESQGDAQFIDFPAISKKLNTDDDFELQATATSGLDIIYEILEGPATLEGSTVSLTGETGLVVISANQPGDDTWAPATEVTQSFLVIDPTDYWPDLTIRRPADGPNVYIEDLGDPILLVASAYIEHPDALEITSVKSKITSSKGEEIVTLVETNPQTGYYSARWTPTEYGQYSMDIIAISTANQESTQTVNFTVTDDITDLNVQAFELEHISTSTSTTVTKDFYFPTFAGSFNDIQCFLDVTCPSGGCDPWDRTGSMEARGPNGEWVELFRYITPYGVPCDHQMDATDYASILQGLVELRFSIGTDSQGFVVDVNFDYQAGTPEYKYSWIDVIWKGTYAFGDYANLQPVEIIDWDYSSLAEASKLKVINTGHGWGSLNSGNAAEFYEATHKIIVNGDEFDQHLWVQCNPNPDGCQPQNGTWYYDRAGWCPGSISYVYDYNLNPYVQGSNTEIQYEFFPGYVDYCHPSHPDCVTGVTCDDCQSGFNPHYIISGNLVTYSNILHNPIGVPEKEYFGLDVYPVPSNGLMYMSSYKTNMKIDAQVSVLNQVGQKIHEFQWNGKQKTLDLTQESTGVYFIVVENDDHKQVEKIIIR